MRLETKDLASSITMLRGERGVAGGRQEENLGQNKQFGHKSEQNDGKTRESIQKHLLPSAGCRANVKEPPVRQTCVM